MSDFADGRGQTIVVPQVQVRAASSVAYPLGYLPALDGMRGLMTLAVIGAHAGLFPKPFPGTMILMDMFFAMSGYLITSILMKDFTKNGSINFGKFYIRRFARLYPALVAMLFVFVVVSYFLSGDFPARLVEAIVNLFYLGNYWTIATGTVFPFMGHLWSLAAEEHFYLVWPIVFSLLLQCFGLSWRTVAWILVLVAALWAIRIFQLNTGTPWPALYVWSHSRADSFLCGSAAAVALPLIRFDRVPWLTSALTWSLLPLLVFTVLCMIRLRPWDLWYYAVSPFFGAIPAIIAVAALLQSRQTFIHCFYQSVILVFCGRICYGLYLWHVPIMTPIHLTYGTAAMIFVGIPLVFLVATLSYYCIERPCMRARPL